MKKKIFYALLVVVALGSCTNPRNINNDIIVINEQTFEISNRFAEGYWLMSVDTNEIEMKGRRIFTKK